MLGFLYGKTEYSILGSSNKIDDYFRFAKENEFSFISITDDNLYGAYKFIKLAKKLNIKPLVGLEFQIDYDKHNEKILAYAYNLEGFRSLIKLSSYSKISGKKFKICELKEYEDNLMFVSTFDDSYLLNLITHNDERYITYLNTLNELKHFGIGISLSNQSNQSYARYLYDFANNENINVFPLSETLYENKEDFKVYEALSLIGNNENFKRGNYYLKDLDEISYEFFGYDKCFSDLEDFINSVQVFDTPVVKSLPVFPNGSDKTSAEFLKSLAYAGLKKRLLKASYDSFENYKQRLDYELSVINKMGYDDYFLIVWDFVKYAKKEGIMVGPGRGSGASSLVAYSIGITNVDPLRYNLLFERFLNPERITMPDIDMDFEDEKRDLVIEYVKNKYGKDNVCSITTFGTFLVKSSIRDLGRVLKVDSQRLNIIVKLASQTEDYDSLLEEYKDNDEIYNLLYVAKKIEGLPKHVGTHASGVVLSCDKLVENTPIQNGINDLYQSQWEKEDMEESGFLKIDFLGIKNLTIINDICKEINGLDNYTIQNIPLDDYKTYNLLCSGDTLGIFQLEKPGAKSVLRRIKPKVFNDLVAVLALCRPGPMSNVDEFVLRKNGKPYKNLHPDLDSILKDTYGIIVYQEQIMQIAYLFAGMSLGEADLLRRAIAKKDEDLLIKERQNFVDHTIKKGYPGEVANQIYDYIVKFADYGFNKSHSVAYAIVSYQMAYFKANYFNIFMAKILNNVIGNSSITLEYINYAKARGLEVLAPSINESNLDYKTLDGKVIFPLLGIKNLGLQVGKKIVEERIQNGKYLSFEDFKRRTNVNQAILKSLIYAGAFDEFMHTKKYLIEASKEEFELFERVLKKDLVQKVEEEYPFDILKAEEFNSIGVNLSYNNFKNIDNLVKEYRSTFFSTKYTNKYINVIVEFIELKKLKTKKNEEMLVGRLTDSKVELSFVIYPKLYFEVSRDIETSRLYLASGKIVTNERYDRNEFQIEAIKKI